VRQTQKIDAATPAFAFPLDLYFRVGGEDRYVTVDVSAARHEFTFPFSSEPAVFCVDPRGGLLKTLTVRAPRTLLREQARSGPTALARLVAVEELSRQPGPDVVEVLEQVLKKEAEFWMVRQAAAQGLGKMQTEVGLQALLRAEKGGVAPARVLAAVLEGLGDYVASPEAHAAVLRHATPGTRLYVQLAAVAALGKLRANPELVAASIAALETAARKPARRAVRAAAFRAMVALDDPRLYETAFEQAQPARDGELRAQIVPVLGRLGRHDGLRDRSRTTLTAWLYEPEPSIQAAAAAGLGALGDPRALADLERIRNSVRSESLRQAAAEAIQAIQRPEDPKRATAGLLERLGVLEKQNQELERKLRELANKVEALQQPSKGQPRKPASNN
jgi:HEAT repeat protein